MKAIPAFFAMLIFTGLFYSPVEAEGSRLSADDTSYLKRVMGIGPDDETLCRLTTVEAERLHRLIRARDFADIKSYLANVYLDQLFDEQHHVARIDTCR